MRGPSLVLRGAWLLLLGIAALLGMAGGWWAMRHPAPRGAPATLTLPGVVTAKAPPPVGPPWIYGRPDARFTIIEYADLECPYCRAYFPVLRHWIDAHPDVSWQWQHLPLPMHEPAATADARLAECAGEAGGNEAFWSALAWIYAHSRGDGRGLARESDFPGLTLAVRQCMASGRPDGVIRAQVEDAAKSGIAATPTLRVGDRQSGRTLVLPGPAEGDALLSAIDWLAGDEAAALPSSLAR